MTQVTFGFSLLPSTDLAAHRELVAVAEDGGLDLVGIQDHPYASRHVETFALTATLLARTSRLRFFPDVANLPLRPPASTRVAAQGLLRTLGVAPPRLWEIRGVRWRTGAP